MATSSSTRYSEITVDLTQVESLQAMAALVTLKGKRARVTSINIHMKNYLWQQDEVNSETMLGVFALLPSFPNLISLTIDLADRTLPLSSLLVVLERPKKLKELHLRRLTITRGQVLQTVLEEQCTLEKVKLSHVRGTAAVQAFMTHLPNLCSLELVSTKISDVGSLTSATVVAACQSPSLRCIRLEDVPDLQDEHVSAVTKVLSSGASKSNLEELHLSSVSLGEESGSALTNLLLTTNILTKVTLDLGYWSQCGTSMAQVLTTNTSLTKLQVLLTGRNQASVNQKTEGIFSALKTNRTLKDLRLSMNNSHSSVGETVHPMVLESLERALAVNHTLENLTLLDDCLDPLSLPPSATSKLDQNHAGLSRLLYNDEDEPCDDDKFYSQYSNLIVQNKNNVDIVFSAILNNPTILSETTCTEEEDTSSSAPEEAVTLAKSSPSSFSNKQRRLSPRSIQRGVRRLRGRLSRSF